MSKEKNTAGNSGRPQQEKGRSPQSDSQRAAGGELHQTAGGAHPPLSTNQGVALSDNQNSLRVHPRGPTLLEDFILREKITHFDHERIPERIVHARDAFGHLKAIAVDKGGQALLKIANVGPDAGVVDANNKDAFITAAKTRQWEREKSVRTLA